MIEVDATLRTPDTAAQLEARPEPRVPIVDEPSTNYLVLGDFGGSAPGPVPVHLDTFDEALSRMNVHVGSLQFHRLGDFHPDRLCERVPLFGDFESETDSKPEIEPPEEKAPAPPPELAELLRSSSLLEQITTGIDPFQRYLRELARAYMSPKRSDDAARDEAVAERLRGVLHHSHFQAIESAWRGIEYLVSAASASKNGRARVFLAQYSRDDANRDLLGAEAGPARASGPRIQELLNSGRWRAIAGLYRFGQDASEIELLRRLASLAAEARTPFFSSCALTEGSADMGPYWNELTAMPEADHLGLALPRFLLRLPYGPHTAPIKSFSFEEMPGTPVHSRYLWGNPSLACLSLLARGGGALDLTGLPLHKDESEAKAAAAPLVETNITEVQELALIEAGLMPLVPSPQSDCARLAGFRAVTGTELPLA